MDVKSEERRVKNPTAKVSVGGTAPPLYHLKGAPPLYHLKQEKLLSLNSFNSFNSFSDDKKITWYSEGAVPPTVTHTCQKRQS